MPPCSVRLETAPALDRLAANAALGARPYVAAVAQNRHHVGDAYLAVAGVPTESSDHALRTAKAALGMKRAMDKVNGDRHKLGLQPWPIRIGLHSGSLIAGVVGAQRCSYDIWGDGVNLAKRMQEACEPGQINISEATQGLISKTYETAARGTLDAKNKGPVKMFYLIGPANV